MMYRLDYGHEKIGNPHFFVTSGYGFWGIPMRLGSQSEVIIIDVKGNKKERSKMTALYYQLALKNTLPSPLSHLSMFRDI